ncbi:MAG: hypothetical protein KatS3mg031_0483 [Chitinophagales bacterium]|nr:MAG: hypothetical protein KatS3mg031_0483 [Chitinophagales bacterium]
MSLDGLQCPRCGSGQLERLPLTSYDKFISLISNDLIERLRCQNCDWSGRAHLSPVKQASQGEKKNR